MSEERIYRSKLQCRRSDATVLRMLAEQHCDIEAARDFAKVEDDLGYVLSQSAADEFSLDELAALLESRP